MKKMVSFRAMPVAMLITVTSVTAACGNGGGEVTAAPQNETARPGATAGLDTHHPENAAFFERFRMPNALLVGPPENLAAGADAATAVIVAEVADVRRTRVVGPPEARVPMTGVVLRPVETLHGKLRPELKDVVVEFPGEATVDSPDSIAALRASLPQGKAVWFLRWQGTPPPTSKPGAGPIPQESRKFYGVVSLDGGMFVQGPENVVSPIAADSGETAGPPTMRKAGERFDKLSELAKRVRALD
ncbi:hypothetical protein [Actinomadura livida]|uniref:DUF5642 domain-containing protein n=2 Tax=Actinomadura livida TaxID=79909 RepID=A0A7W7MXL8_9ACTN|nr:MULTISPECIES: hypothetical protein [Actinomadura]MBB4773915.1 hypothetical protein [Actinomadura catellatispora]